MIILVLNCGSSSIKYQVIDMSENGHTVLAKGLVERIGLGEGMLTHKKGDQPKHVIIREITDHTVGINMIISLLSDPQRGVIASLEELGAVGHRVVHGGEFFSDSALIDGRVMAQIEKCFDLAPLHNPANLKGILAIENLLEDVPQVAVFDTSFHQSMPSKSFLYALPYSCYAEMRVRRYGFHGTSHRFVAEKACAMTGIELGNSKIVTCHIGNGGSVTAIINGRSYDTSMGFTPVDGLIMGTRCGSVDPGALLFIADKKGHGVQQISDLINKQSGVLGLTGVSSDMRDIQQLADEGNERAQLTLEMYYERVKKFVGSYAAAMEGIDMLVFTGGVGENDPNLRSYVCRGLEFMGVKLDPAANDGTRGQDKILSHGDSRVKVVVASTDEELVIAQDTFKLTK